MQMNTTNLINQSSGSKYQEEDDLELAIMRNMFMLALLLQ